MATDDRGISFDGTYKIRVLDTDKHRQTLELQESCRGFVGKMVQLNEVVKGLVEQMSVQAQKIESEKLQAVGQRNTAAAEAELRKRQLKEQKGLVSETLEELERLHAEYDSLVKVQQEQELLIAKLSDSSA